MINISNHHRPPITLQVTNILTCPEAMFSIVTIENSTLRFNIQLPQNIHMMINGATMSISINEVLYRLTNEYHQTVKDRLCYIIVLIDNSNDITCAYSH